MKRLWLMSCLIAFGCERHTAYPYEVLPGRSLMPGYEELIEARNDTNVYRMWLAHGDDTRPWIVMTKRIGPLPQFPDVVISMKRDNW